MWAKMLRRCCSLCLLLCMLPAVAEAVEVSATAAVLLDADTGQVLYEKNGDEQMLIASTTKIMTALVVLEQAGLDDTVTVTRDHMAEGSSMYLKPGETVRVEELLYGLLLCSGNDAALALTACAGGPEPFVALMNEKAAALGMTRTSFANPQRTGRRGALLHGAGYGSAGRRSHGGAYVPTHLLQPQRHYRPAHHGEPQPPAAAGGGLHRPEDRVYQGGGAYAGVLRRAVRLPPYRGDTAGQRRLGRPRGAVRIWFLA